jgi:hypothetical protein
MDEAKDEAPVEVELRANEWVRLPGTTIEVLLHGKTDSVRITRATEGYWPLPYACDVRQKLTTTRPEPRLRWADIDVTWRDRNSGTADDTSDKTGKDIVPGNSGPGW